MRRMLALLIPVTLVVAITIVEWDKIVAWSKNSKDVIPFMLSVLQLIGIIIILALAVAIIMQYIMYLRPHRFIFEGFSNSQKLAEKEKNPLDLNILAREELIKQFNLMKRDLPNGDDNKGIGIDDLLTKNQDSQSRQEGDNKILSPFDKSMEKMMKSYLNEVSQSLGPKATDFNNLVKEISLPEADFVMQLINAAIPPHAIKATSHLQWREEAPDSNQVGITLELEDLSKQCILDLGTIWWQPSKHHPTPAKGNDLAVYYTELLAPAMRWMAVMFFEHQRTLHIPPANSIPIFRYLPSLQRREKKRQAVLHFMLAALYFNSVQKHPEYEAFFLQLVFDHFNQAIHEVPDWYLPYLYMANVYSFSMQNVRGEAHEKLFGEAMSLYKEALAKAELAGEEEPYAQYRVCIAMALSNLASAIVIDNDERAKSADEELNKLIRKLDPADLKPEQAGCDVCLYNLALFYVTAYEQKLAVADSRRKGQRYLAYYLARFPDGWNTLDEIDPKKKFIKPLKALRGKDLKGLSGEELREAITHILEPGSDHLSERKDK